MNHQPSNIKHQPALPLAFLAFAMFAGIASAEAPVFADATPQDNFKLSWLIKTDRALTIDGRLDEAVWKEAKPLEDWGITNYGRQKGKLGTIDFRAAWDDTYLYIGARMYHQRDPRDMAELRRQMGNVTQPIYARECLELHIDGNLDHATRFQSIMNGLGEKMMIWFYDFGWGILKNVDYGLDADWDGAGRIEDDHWTLEVRYALADIQVEPRVGCMFAMNPCWFNWADTRENTEDYWWQFQTWSTHGDSHHDPRLYGRFILVEKEPDDIEAGLRLAMPDLDDRRVMIQTDEGYLVLEKGRKTLQPYDEQVRAEAKHAREDWNRVQTLLKGSGTTFSRSIEKTVLPAQEEPLRAVEEALRAGAKLSRGELAGHRKTLAEVASAVGDAYWRVKQDVMLTGLGGPGTEAE